MNLKSYLFKPGWQNKDPQVRAAVVAESEEPELLAELPAICLDDEDPQVRLAAARRLRDLPTLLAAAARPRGPEELRVLGERIRALAGSTGEDRPPLEQRLAVAADTGDRALLESLARHAPEAELRRLAVSRLDLQGLLGDVAIQDPDAQTRRAAAARISQHSTLLRVIEATRKSDKALHAELSERLHAERLAAGDPDTVAEVAQRICAALERMAVAAERPDVARRTALDRDWAVIADLVPKVLHERHAAVLQRLDRPADAPPTEAPAPPDPEPQAAAPIAAPAAPPAAAEPGEPAESPADSTAGKASANPPPARRDFPERLDELLATLRGQLEAGELAHALATRAELLELGKPLGRHPRWRRMQGEMHRLHGRLRELRDWQHWSNNKARKQLIAEMEALPGSGLHPDAVLARLKELQAQWKELEGSEQIPGEKHFSAAPGLWRRFQAAGRAAFASTKPFLDKRSEVQARHLEELKAVRARLDEAARLEDVDWGELRAAVAAGAKAMRSLGELPPRQRGKAGSRLKKSLERANARLQEHYQALEKVKLGLIRSASALEHAGDRAEAIATAKGLQAQWSAAGSLWRSQEQKLWKQFRSHLDPLFAELRGEQQAQRETNAANRQRQQELLDGLQAVLDLDDEQVAEQRGKVQGLRDAWSDIEGADPKLRQKFQAMDKAFSGRLRALARREADAERERWWAKSELLHSLENKAEGGTVNTRSLQAAKKKWPAGGDTPTDQALDARLAALEQGQAAPAGCSEGSEAARMLAIRMEFLAGMPSPDEDREARMRYQVDRLSRTLAGARETGSARDEARELEREWLLLPPLAADEHAAFKTRIRTAMQEIFRE